MEQQNQNNSLALLNENVPTLTQLLLVNMPEGTTEMQAKRKAVREIMNIEAILSMKPELLVCEPHSIMLCVKQCIADNLTLSPAAGLVYLYPQGVCIGTDPKTNAKVYKQVMVYDPTSEGRISIARQAGSILDHRRPVCIYDLDGKVESVSFSFLVPVKGWEPRWETVTFGTADFDRWKKKSEAKFGGKANPNYTSYKDSIDPEFAGSKAIRHALKKLGTNANEMRIQQPQATVFAAELKSYNFDQARVEHKAEPVQRQLEDCRASNEESVVHDALIMKPTETDSRKNNNLDINPDDL